MNPLLARQLRKHLPHLDPKDAEWQSFLSAVDSAYTGFQNDHTFVENTLEVTSAELTEANERLRRESENQLAAVMRYYQQVLALQQGMILCVVRKAEGFVHTLCRGQLADRLSLRSDAVEGRTIEQVAEPANIPQLNAAYARAWAGEEHSFTYINAKTGIEVLVMMRPRYEQGVVCEVIASCIEVTALKDAERQLRAAKERAEAADRAKSEFLAVMSHEIRTPLNAILGFSTLLKDSPLTKDQHTRIDTICTAGDSLLALVDDILDFSKIEAGQLSLHPEPLAIPTLVDAVSSLFQMRAAAKGLILTTVIAPEVPVLVQIDIHRLRQILVNLVGNALKFTARGSIHLAVERGGTAEIGGTCQLRFSVTDTGIGIPANRRDRLFKPFSQVDSSTTRQYGGTGLGLAISARLARLLGGDISVTSEPGAGSTFSFTIQASVLDVPAPRATRVPSARAPRAQGGLRILVAEDQPANRLLIEDYLTDHGHSPDVVENGQLAIAAAEAKEYDLILMDVLMPEVDGFTAARAIRTHFTGQRQPRIVALTANVFPEDREHCRQAGMDGFLAKPIDFEQLHRVLNGDCPNWNS